MKVLLFILSVALLALAARFGLREPWRGRAMNLLKAVVTVGAFWLLLTHPVKMEDGSRVIAWSLILDTVRGIDAATFAIYVAAAAGIKFVGILASMLRWYLLLLGQGIELPFRHIFGSFLIGRFIGTFLPSTAGLDGYKLYDAARFSGRTVEVTAATALEKVIGVSGIFLTFLVSLPFGIYIFGERAGMVAAVTVPLATGVIGALLLLLWYPTLFQWVLDRLPLPGRARLEGLFKRISRAASAYRNRRFLVLAVFFLSFLVHFTTAAMYYFTALAISATGVEFWSIVFGSSIQIFATVVSPFTIAGEGIREAAQYLLLSHLIGPGKAIVSAALGFWAAEALTLAGGFFWWFRGARYRPAYCRVDGRQVDYDEAARAALSLETEEERAAREGAPTADLPPLPVRAWQGLTAGLGGGVLGGVILGVAETFVISRGGFGEEAQVLWYGPLAYSVVLGVLGALGGAVLAVLPLDEDEIRGWTPSLVLLATLVPLGLFITVFRLRRDVFAEQMPPAPVLLGVLAAFGLLALALLLFGRNCFLSRAGRVGRPLPALLTLGVVIAGGVALAGRIAPGPPPPPAPPPIPAPLAGRPNIVLIMVDTLRADHLSCYGGPARAPAICGLLEDGTRYLAFSHASWTKPATATLLTATLPSSHGAMSKPSVLPDEAVLVSEVLRDAGYTTGGIVSNINLAPSFGFDQGYDEYVYLAPDYLAGAKESSSKLILYQLARQVVYRLKPGHRVGDFYQDSEVVNRVAFDWLDRNREARFFLFLHYMDPHDPYFRHPYDGHAIARVQHPHPDPSMAEEMRELYIGEIEYLDRNIGRLFERMRELGLYDDALIVLTADHGEEFHDHGGFWHGLTLYDEQIHIPLLVKWPAGRREAPRELEDALVRHIDVAPTLIRRAGGQVPAAMQGVDLVGAEARTAEKDTVVYAEEDHEGNVLSAVRTLRWKLLTANEGNPRGLPPRELFDVAADPRETENLYDREPTVVAELDATADRIRRYALGEAVAGHETAELSREECERLAMLGYADPADCAKLR